MIPGRGGGLGAGWVRGCSGAWVGSVGLRGGLWGGAFGAAGIWVFAWGGAVGAVGIWVFERGGGVGCGFGAGRRGGCCGDGRDDRSFSWVAAMGE